MSKIISFKSIPSLLVLCLSSFAFGLKKHGRDPMGGYVSESSLNHFSPEDTEPIFLSDIETQLVSIETSEGQQIMLPEDGLFRGRVSKILVGESYTFDLSNVAFELGQIYILRFREPHLILAHNPTSVAGDEGQEVEDLYSSV